MAEPILECDEIQGDSIAGFRKDFATFLFFEFDVSAKAPLQAWIASMADRLAYADVVLPFNKAFRTMRLLLSGNDPPLRATWMNLAFTNTGVNKLLEASDQQKLDPTFLAGAAAHASFVGDPSDGSAGDPRNWIIGGPRTLFDGVLIIAADSEQDRDDLVTLLMSEMQQILPAGTLAFHREDGNTRGNLRGHEHFGFKDGISQPGIRGLVNHAKGPNVTQRILDPSDPLSSQFAAPGEPLCWPGTFVLGYPKKRPGSNDPNQVVTDPVPPWMRNGSYIVYRRLRQDVLAFDAFFDLEARTLAGDPDYSGIPTVRLKSLCVGRWPSGTPISRQPLLDGDLGLQNDIYAQNNVFFDRDSVAPLYRPDLMLKPDTYPMAQADAGGHTCPFASHIRKVNPRDDTTEQGKSTRTLEHRILRRGIPYGPPYDPNIAGSDAIDRGLQFVCYQASIDDGFGFLMNQWVNNVDAPHTGGGVDPIIGNASAPTNLLPSSGRIVPIPINKRFVIATGAAYLYAPSRSALKRKFGSG